MTLSFHSTLDAKRFVECVYNCHMEELEEFASWCGERGIAWYDCFYLGIREWDLLTHSLRLYDAREYKTELLDIGGTSNVGKYKKCMKIANGYPKYRKLLRNYLRAGWRGADRMGKNEDLEIIYYCNGCGKRCGGKGRKWPLVQDSLPFCSRRCIDDYNVRNMLGIRHPFAKPKRAIAALDG